MEPIWLRSYPPDIPHSVRLDRFSSLPDMLSKSCARFGDLCAYENLGRQLSFAELDALSRDFAAFLSQNLGLVPGERIALMLPNLLSQPVACHGALRAGLVLVNVNPLYTPRELAHQLADSGASAIVVLENFAATLEAVLPELPSLDARHVIVATAGDLLPWPKRALVRLVLRKVKRAVPAIDLPGSVSFETALDRGHGLPFHPPELGQEDLAFLQYTGGTTGISKGAMLTHGNILANLAQADAWLAPHLEEGREVVITALPLYHIFALLVNGFLFIQLGGRSILVTNPRDLPAFVKTLRKHPPTVITGVNTLFNALLDAPGVESVDWSKLKLTVGGGMAVQRATAERWQALTGRPIVEAYGLTEASPAVCVNPLDLPEYNASVGLPLPSTEVCIRADSDIEDELGAELPPGEVGEICLRGPQVMRGYWQRPEETALVLDAEGWLRTGDLGRMDAAGLVYVQDRKKDMLIVSGFNVYPNEIEDVVCQHPQVREAAVIGMPHARSGEAVRLFVVRRDEGLVAEEIQRHCREHLAAYKCPKVIEFRESLPKNNIGKVLRRALREEGA